MGVPDGLDPPGVEAGALHHGERQLGPAHFEGQGAGLPIRLVEVGPHTAIAGRATDRMEAQELEPVLGEVAG